MAFWIPALIIVSIVLRARQVMTIASLAGLIIRGTRPQNFRIVFQTAEHAGRAATQFVMSGQVLAQRGSLVLSRFDVRVTGAMSNSAEAANTVGLPFLRQVAPRIAELAHRTNSTQVVIQAQRVAGARVNAGAGPADIERVFRVVGERLIPMR